MNLFMLFWSEIFENEGTYLSQILHSKKQLVICPFPPHFIPRISMTNRTGSLPAKQRELEKHKSRVLITYATTRYFSPLPERMIKNFIMS